MRRTFTASRSTGRFDPHGEPVGLSREEKSEDDSVCRMTNNGLSKRYLYPLAVSYSPCGSNRLDSHFNGISQQVATSPMGVNERFNREEENCNI